MTDHPAAPAPDAEELLRRALHQMHELRDELENLKAEREGPDTPQPEGPTDDRRRGGPPEMTDARDAARLRELLTEAGDELRHARVFIKTREKMHPDGIFQYEVLIDRIDAAMKEGK